MNLKTSLLVALFSFGIAQSAFAETDEEKFKRAMHAYEQGDYLGDYLGIIIELSEKGFAKAQHERGLILDESRNID